MRKLLFLAVMGSLGILGCTNEAAKSPSPPAGSDVKTPPASPAGPFIAEVSCAHCQYKAPGVTACAPGVKVNGKTYVLTGAPVDVVKEGLCATAKQATVEGKIEGDKFVATKVEIKK
jgi:hypothetical protein